MRPKRLDASAPGFEKEFSAFLGRNRDTDENVDRIAADIVADVRARGDAALVGFGDTCALFLHAQMLAAPGGARKTRP